MYVAILYMHMHTMYILLLLLLLFLLSSIGYTHTHIATHTHSYIHTYIHSWIRLVCAHVAIVVIVFCLHIIKPSVTIIAIAIYSYEFSYNGISLKIFTAVS